MTAYQIYTLAAAFVGDKAEEDKDNRDLSVPYLNVLLAESLSAENSIRAANGDTELETAPVLTALTDEIVYSDRLAKTAFPYGLAWQYHQEAGNLQLSALYRNLFVDAVESAKMIVVR